MMNYILINSYLAALSQLYQQEFRLLVLDEHQQLQKEDAFLLRLLCKRYPFLPDYQTEEEEYLAHLWAYQTSFFGHQQNLSNASLGHLSLGFYQQENTGVRDALADWLSAFHSEFQTLTSLRACYLG